MVKLMYLLLYKHITRSPWILNCDKHTVLSFTLLGNRVGVTGVEAFLISIQRQAEVSSSAGKPTGLMRFSLSVSNSTEQRVQAL